MRSLAIPLFVAIQFNPLFAIAGSTVHGAGPVLRTPLVIEAIRGIRVTGEIDVEIKQAPVQSVLVEAQANLVPLLMTTVRNGVWTIDTGDKQYSTSERFVVHISVPTLEHITSDGPASILCAGTFTTNAFEVVSTGNGSVSITIAANRITLLNDGPGAITVGGTCAELKATARDSGPIRVHALSCGSAMAKIDGNGDIILGPTDRMVVAITGSGDVILTGKVAEVASEIDGPGRVRYATATPD